MQVTPQILHHKQRVIDFFFNENLSKTAIFIAGIHGNEQSGITALQQVFSELRTNQTPINGNFIALKGNVKAIEQNERFIDVDLNRAWTHKDLNSSQTNSETEEIRELKKIIDPLLEQYTPTLLVDLHTTSSQSAPFCIIKNSEQNRKQVQEIPTPTILGIIEKLEGTIIGHYSNRAITTVFEAGEHNDPSSITRHKAIIYLSLVQFGIINKKDINYQHHFNLLTQATQDIPKLLKTTLRYSLQANDTFKMQPNFKNFSPIKQGQLLAYHNNEPVLAQKDSFLFMPLYQNKGSDGFFIVEEIPFS